MELTLDQALQKGVEAHKAGKAQEADQYYTAILKANPKHPDANHNMGVLLLFPFPNVKLSNQWKKNRHRESGIIKN